MELRKEKHIKDFIYEIDRVWKISLTEKELLDSVFNLILQGDIEKMCNLTNLYCNEEYAEILDLVPDFDIQYYAERYLNLVEFEECNCEENTVDDFDNGELIAELSERGFTCLNNYVSSDIIMDMNTVEMANLFLSLTPQKQFQAIELLKTL